MPPRPPASPKPRSPRGRRLGVGFGVLAVVVLGLAGMQWYRGHQLVTSCTDNGGQWDAERQACTFGGAGPDVPTPDPEPR